MRASICLTATLATGMAMTSAPALAQTTSTTNASQFGTDTRAFHFFGDGTGTHYAGGYVGPDGSIDYGHEYNPTPNGSAQSTLDYTFNGQQQVDRICTYTCTNVYVPASARSYASADLSTGKLRAYATDEAFVVPNPGGTPDHLYTFNQSRTNASFEDTIKLNFDPSVTGYVTIGLRTALDGSFTFGAPNGAGSIYDDLRTTVSGQGFDGSNPSGTRDGFYTGYFGANPYSQSTFTNFGGNVYGYDITVPVGQITLDVFELLSANAYGATVDYSHTSTLSLVLPEGVTYTSASGTFLSEADPSAVPEPATWAMMIAGVGAVGFAIRRRKAATRLSYAA